MIRIGRVLGNGHCQGEVVCHNCGAAAPIELWQVEPAVVKVDGREVEVPPMAMQR